MKPFFLDRILISFIFSILIIFPKIICEDSGSLKDITTSVSNACKEYGEKNKVRQFSDCNSFSNLDNNQVCCYLSGIEADKSHYGGCIAVSSTLFLNKTISYSSKWISGNLICTDNYISHNYINTLMFEYIWYFIYQIIILF